MKTTICFLMALVGQSLFAQLPFPNNSTLQYLRGTNTVIASGAVSNFASSFASTSTTRFVTVQNNYSTTNAAATGSASFKWQVSLDSVGWTDITNLVVIANGTATVSTNALIDVGMNYFLRCYTVSNNVNYAITNVFAGFGYKINNGQMPYIAQPLSTNLDGWTAISTNIIAVLVGTNTFWQTNISYTSVTNAPWQMGSANLTNWSSLSVADKQAYHSHLVSISASNGFAQKLQYYSTAATAVDWTSNNLYAGIVKLSSGNASYYITNTAFGTNTLVHAAILDDDATITSLKVLNIATNIIQIKANGNAAANCRIGWSLIGKQP